MQDPATEPAQDDKPLEQIKFDGKPYFRFDVAAARAQIGAGTLVRWAEIGVTNFGMPLDLVRDPAHQILYVSKATVTALANRFQSAGLGDLKTQRPPPPPIPEPLEWKESNDGRFVQYGGKTYLPRKRATLGLGLRGTVLKHILEDATLPSGEVVDVIQHIETRATFVSSEAIDRLKRRFVYEDTGESVGPYCKVHDVFGSFSNHRGQENELRPYALAIRELSLGLWDDAEVRASFDDDRSQLENHVYSWLLTGTGPDGKPLRTVRDSITAAHFVTLATLGDLPRRYFSSRAH